MVTQIGGASSVTFECCSSCGSHNRWHQRRVGRGNVVLPALSVSFRPALTEFVQIAIVVPFREQFPLQDRQSQLQRFIPHMELFLNIQNCRVVIIIVEQTMDERKFNRGQLLNIGFKLALKTCPGLTSVILHDVDLLPSFEMRLAYATPPPISTVVHLASVWSKYKYPGFIGGVLSLRPHDFECVNGYPNDYWGWGLEDDQLGLRIAHCKFRVLCARMGSFVDIDPENMKTILETKQGEELRQHISWYNPKLFQRGELFLDENWSQNGLRNLRYNIIQSSVQGILQHFLVHLGGSELKH